MIVGGHSQTKLLDDILPRHFIGRRRESHDGCLRESVVQNAQLRILGSEIVSPLADAVSFVNGDETDLDFTEQERDLCDQPFGRHIKKFDVAGQTTPLDDQILIHIVAAVERFGRDTIGFERFHLIIHQTDQRRHHNSRPRQGQSRNLVTQTLPAACRHQHEAIVARDNIVDDFALVRSERAEPIILFEKKRYIHCRLLPQSYGFYRKENGSRLPNDCESGRGEFRLFPIGL